MPRPTAIVHAIDVLEAVRRRTLGMVASLDAPALVTQHDPILSPIVWDLGHIANFEEQWMDRADLVGGLADTRAIRDQLYDPVRNPRRVRGELPLLSPEQAIAYLATTRADTLERVAAWRPRPDDPLRADGFVLRMLAQHEAQHVETILQAVVMSGIPYDPPWPVEGLERASARAAGGMVAIPSADVPIGTDDRTFAYDNERPRHVVSLRAYHLDVAPVTNGAFLRFVEDGGYACERHWHPDGWAWLRDTRVTHPRCWRHDAEGTWWETVRGRTHPLANDRSVVHVSWYEADAYARWAGRRLPTEAEWEHGVRRAALRTDVWEWTASTFESYPGYVTFPYPEYSEIHFQQGYRVLRGGSWATHPLIARPTFRNWDLPQRRQIFAGFRCARDG